VCLRDRSRLQGSEKQVFITYHYQRLASLFELRPTKETMRTNLYARFSILATTLVAFTQLSTLNPQPASAQSPVPDSFNQGLSVG
jgi:hypothetical protein